MSGRFACQREHRTNSTMHTVSALFRHRTSLSGRVFVLQFLTLRVCKDAAHRSTHMALPSSACSGQVGRQPRYHRWARIFVDGSVLLPCRHSYERHVYELGFADILGKPRTLFTFVLKDGRLRWSPSIYRTKKIHTEVTTPVAHTFSVRVAVSRFLGVNHTEASNREFQMTDKAQTSIRTNQRDAFAQGGSGKEQIIAVG